MEAAVLARHENVLLRICTLLHRSCSHCVQNPFGTLNCVMEVR